MATFGFEDELAEFLPSGNSVVVATRSASLEPFVTRACGIRVEPPDRLVVLLPRATSAKARANLDANGEIAVCVSSPIDYRTVQIKGRCVEVVDASADDVALAEEQLRRFAERAARFGRTRAQARNLWLFECWRATVRVTSAFAQTPGPGAGERLEVGRAR